MPRSPAMSPHRLPVPRSASMHRRHPQQIKVDMVEQRVNRSCFLTLLLGARAPAPVTRGPGTASGSCFAGSRSPRPPPLAPPAPPPFYFRLCSSASQLLWEVRLLGSFIIGFGSSPSRCGPVVHPAKPKISRFPYEERARHARGLRPRRTGRTLAFVASARIAFHVKDRVCVRNKNHFRGSMAGLCVPLSTLRRRPHGRLRMTRATVVRYSFSAVDSHHYSSPVSPAHP